MSEFKPKYLAQGWCAASVPGEDVGVEMPCGEEATCWLDAAREFGRHPRCEAHKGVRAGFNVTDERCRDRLLRAVRGGPVRQG